MAVRKKKTRKKASKSSALAVRGSSEVAVVPDMGDMQEEYERILNRDAAATQIAVGGWPFIGTEGGIFSHKTVGTIGDSFDALVIAWARGNFLYEGKYTPGGDAAVKCYALTNDVTAEMAPPADLATRESVNGCEKCWASAFGTDDRGKGKACREYVIVAGIPISSAEDLEPGVLKKAEGFRLRVPPTSMAAFANYAGEVTKAGKRAFFTVLTRFTISKHATKQFEVTAEEVGPIQEVSALRAIMARHDEATSQVLAPPPLVRAEEDEGDTGGHSAITRPARKSKKKKVTRRKR